MAEDDDTLNHVLELADVARPGVSQKPLVDLAGDVQVFVVFAVVDRQVVVREQQDVVSPLPQGRDVNGDHVEPVVEVLSEAARADHFLQGLIGGGDDAHVNGDIFLAAQLFDLSLLEYAQQLGLHGHGHIADFVQKEGSALGQLEFAHTAAPLGPGEGPFLIAKEFALNEGLWDGGAVDGDEGLVFPGAVVPQDAGKHLFAHAVLAPQQDRRVGLGHRHRLQDAVGVNLALTNHLALLQDGLGLQLAAVFLRHLGDALHLLVELVEAGDVGEDGHGPLEPAVKECGVDADGYVLVDAANQLLFLRDWPVWRLEHGEQGRRRFQALEIAPEHPAHRYSQDFGVGGIHVVDASLPINGDNRLVDLVQDGHKPLRELGAAQVLQELPLDAAYALPSAVHHPH